MNTEPNKRPHVAGHAADCQVFGGLPCTCGKDRPAEPKAGETGTPRYDSFLKSLNGGPLTMDDLESIRQLERELNICRVALGIHDGDKILLDQTPKHGSILIDVGSSRKRISPINDDIVRLEQQLAQRDEELKIAYRDIETFNKELERVKKERDELVLKWESIQAGERMAKRTQELIDAALRAQQASPKLMPRQLRDEVIQEGDFAPDFGGYRPVHEIEVGTRAGWAHGIIRLVPAPLTKQDEDDGFEKWFNNLNQMSSIRGDKGMAHAIWKAARAKEKP